MVIYYLKNRPYHVERCCPTAENHVRLSGHNEADKMMMVVNAVGKVAYEKKRVNYCPHCGAEIRNFRTCSSTWEIVDYPPVEDSKVMVYDQFYSSKPFVGYYKNGRWYAQYQGDGPGFEVEVYPTIWSNVVKLPFSE